MSRADALFVGGVVVMSVVIVIDSRVRAKQHHPKWRSVPICDQCWIDEAGIRQQPVRLRAANDEHCYRCSAVTRGGIYVRKFV